MRTSVFVDGFNLYYGLLQDGPHRWLDLAKLCRLLLPDDEIHAIHYYTAPVAPRPENPHQSTRQRFYLRALATIPNLRITYGHFRTHAKRLPLAEDPARTVEVLQTQEKGSDVNLAVHLVYQGMRGEYDTAVVVSNDSDLAEPLRIAAREIGKQVGVLSPAKSPSRELVKHAGFWKPIRRSVLAAS